MQGVSGFADLVAGGGVAPSLVTTDKAGLLQVLAGMAAAETGLSASLILERVRERETLGSTGFGGGAAIPHARIPGLDQVVVVLARLAAPIDYGALDGDPVDIAVLLLSPEGAGADHLKALARISRSLRDPDVLDAIRAAGDSDALLQAIGPGAAVRLPLRPVPA
ncbi:MAG: transcriptional regulator [Alphaproteobacteria bacterium PA4]|nr:MAG: transcriptional regulator [Alphaproteobacteria bacterium PA4]